MANEEEQERALRNKTFGATSGGAYMAETVKESGRTVATSLDPKKTNVGDTTSIEGKVGEQKFTLKGKVSGKDTVAVQFVVKKDDLFGDKTFKLSEPLEVKYEKNDGLSEQSLKNIQAVLFSEHTKGEVKIPSGIPFFPKTITVTDVTDSKANQVPKPNSQKRASIGSDMQVALAQVDAMKENPQPNAFNAVLPNKQRGSTGTELT